MRTSQASAIATTADATIVTDIRGDDRVDRDFCCRVAEGHFWGFESQEPPLTAAIEDS